MPPSDGRYEPARHARGFPLEPWKLWGCWRLISVALETDSSTVVSFNVADGSANWTSQPGGSVNLVAATEGNGLVVNEPTYDPSTYSYVSNIVQLDNTGNVADPFTVNTASLQYDVGDQWLALGSTENIVGPALFWAASSFPDPTQNGIHQAYHHYTMDLFFCTGGVCGPQQQDVDFSYYQGNPQYQPAPFISLTPLQQMAVKDQAFRALRIAFAGYPVKFDVSYYSSPPVGVQEIWVAGNPPFLYTDPNTGQSGEPCGITNSNGFSRISFDYYDEIMEQAQYAPNLQIPPGNAQTDPSFNSLLNAIGEGIGNTAAHEIGWQLPPSGLQGMDDDSVGTYNGISCDGSEDPARYEGSAADGTPIHWEGISAQSLRNVIYAK